MKTLDIIGIPSVFAFAISRAIEVIVASQNGWVVINSYNTYSEGPLEVVLSLWVLFYMVWFTIRIGVYFHKYNLEQKRVKENKKEWEEVEL